MFSVYTYFLVCTVWCALSVYVFLGVHGMVCSQCIRTSWYAWDGVLSVCMYFLVCMVWCVLRVYVLLGVFSMYGYFLMCIGHRSQPRVKQFDHSDSFHKLFFFLVATYPATAQPAYIARVSRLFENNGS